MKGYMEQLIRQLLQFNVVTHLFSSGEQAFNHSAAYVYAILQNGGDPSSGFRLTPSAGGVGPGPGVGVGLGVGGGGGGGGTLSSSFPVISLPFSPFSSSCSSFS